MLWFCRSFHCNCLRYAFRFSCTNLCCSVLSSPCYFDFTLGCLIVTVCGGPLAPNGKKLCGIAKCTRLTYSTVLKLFRLALWGPIIKSHCAYGQLYYILCLGLSSLCTGCKCGISSNSGCYSTLVSGIRGIVVYSCSSLMCIELCIFIVEVHHNMSVLTGLCCVILIMWNSLVLSRFTN